MISDRDKIENILLGTGTDQDIDCVPEVSSLRRSLEKETALDAAIMEWANNDLLPVQKDDLSSEEWFGACIPQKKADWETEQLNSYSDNTWNQLIGKAFSNARPQAEFITDDLDIFSKRSLIHYLIAASLILVVGISFVFINQNRNNNIERLSHSTLSADTPASLSNRNSTAVNLAKKPVKKSLPAADTSWNLYQLGSKTKAVVNRNSRFKKIVSNDSIIIVSLDYGSAEFIVEKKRYSAFIVKTPFAEIHVTGTIFTVNVGKTFSLTGVKEGSVLVTHLTGKVSSIIKTGESVLANEDTLLAVLEKRASQPVLRPHTSINVEFPDPYRNPRIPGEDSRPIAEYRNILKKIRLNQKGIDSTVYSFLKSNRFNQFQYLLIELADMYKRCSNFTQAQQIYDTLAQNGKAQISELALFKNALLLLDSVKDTVSASTALDKYLSKYPEGEFMGDAVYSLVCIGTSRQWNNVDSIVDRYLENFPENKMADHIILRYADYLLNAKHDPEKALMLYTQILDNFPESKLLQDAAQGASSSIIKRAIIKVSSRATFSYISKGM